MKRDSRSNILKKDLGSLQSSVEQSSERLGDSLSGLLRDSSACAFVAPQFSTAVKLLARQLAAKGPVEAADHAGGWLRMVALQHPEIFAEFPFTAEVLSPILDLWRGSLSVGLDATGQEDLYALIDRLRLRLSERAPKTIRALFIGDCLVWEVATQVQIHAHALDFDVEPKLVAKRVGADLRRSLKAFSPDQFDLIFYSPFSFGFSEIYAQFTAPQKMLQVMAKGRWLLQEAAEDAQKTIQLLHYHFGCPIYVHTVSGIRQNNPGWRGMLGNLLTLPMRRLARAYINRRLSPFVAGLTAMGKPAVRRIDESEPLTRMSGSVLGQVIYNAGELHTTALAQELARGPYIRACKVIAHLKNRKLVVCDLDNTLWDGVIGDGPVLQRVDRQRALLRLKAKGVVLAVSSKNDPANVRWEEAIVSPSDFVALEINWGRKVANIRKMSEALNLNPNSFVFLDDRHDEREAVTAELEDVLALDPNDPDTWKLIEEWTGLLNGAEVKDRTTLYQNRMARQSYLVNQQDLEADAAEAYRKLDLRLTLRHPKQTDMARVVELINRTNQFNTTAARTSIEEITHPALTRRIVVAEARDKFGEMGIIGVLVVTDDGRLRITHFVLSCRVFGFCIENAMVQSVLSRVPDRRLTAELVRTPLNGPCQEVYGTNGFILEGGIWVSQGHRPALVPDWLAVDDECSRTTASQGAM